MPSANEIAAAAAIAISGIDIWVPSGAATRPLVSPCSTPRRPPSLANVRAGAPPVNAERPTRSAIFARFCRTASTQTASSFRPVRR